MVEIFLKERLETDTKVIRANIMGENKMMLWVEQETFEQKINVMRNKSKLGQK